MFLPKGSRIVVLDDKEAEAAPLLKALSKQGCSASYFSGEESGLPQQPFTDVRIAFLDLKLTAGVNGAANVASNAVGILSRIVAKNSRYILVVWTANTESIAPLDGYLASAEILPMVPVIDLDKTECRNAADPIKMIEDKIKEKLQDQRPMFGYFLAWENIVNEATSDVVNGFTLLSDAKDPKLSHTLYKLAKAHSGSNLVDDVNEIARGALRAFGGVLEERVGTKIGAFDFATLDKPKEDAASAAGVETAINAKLNIVTEHLGDMPVPGNVYEQTGVTNEALTAMIKAEYGSDQFTDDKIAAAITDGLKPIFLEVSPVCDHAQRNVLVHRVIYGILCPSSVLPKKKKQIRPTGEALYAPPFFFDLDGKPRTLVLNKRRLVTMEAQAINGLKPIFRVGSDWLFDIQHKIAGHVSRPGITSLSIEE